MQWYLQLLLNLPPYLKRFIIKFLKCAKQGFFKHQIIAYTSILFIGAITMVYGWNRLIQNKDAIYYSFINRNYNKTLGNKEVEKELRAITKNCGHGHTFTKAVFKNNVKPSVDQWHKKLTFDFVFSCDYDKNSNDCIIDNIKSFPELYAGEHELNKESSDLLESDIIVLDGKNPLDFSEFNVVSIPIFLKNSKAFSVQIKSLESQANDLFLILKKVQTPLQKMNDLKIIKIRDIEIIEGVATLVVVLYMASRWTNFDTNCSDQAIESFLRHLAKKDKRLIGYF